jgi:hypothetical protein
VALVLASLELPLWAVLVLQVYAHGILYSDEPMSVGRVQLLVYCRPSTISCVIVGLLCEDAA